MTGFSEASIAPIRALRAAELRLGERRAAGKGRAVPIGCCWYSCSSCTLICRWFGRGLN